MALLDLWKSDRSQIDEKRVDQAHLIRRRQTFADLIAGESVAE